MRAVPVRRPGLAAGEEAEFSWTPQDFARVQALIYRHAGIHLHDGKRAMVYSRLSRRLRETGHRRFGDYLDALESQDPMGSGADRAESGEWQQFVNALTTNLTAFFREPHHFAVLGEYFSAGAPGRVWKLWCSAASTGEEAYSIAMTAVEAGVSFKLLASDIDSRVLAKAEAGVYRAEQVRPLDDERLQRFFLRGKGANQGMVRVKPELAGLVNFQRINLISGNWPMEQAFDVIFCRNVMIYFDSVTQRQVLEHLHQTLRPGGLLMAGHAENFSKAQDLFRLRGRTVYERL